MYVIRNTVKVKYIIKVKNKKRRDKEKKRTGNINTCIWSCSWFSLQEIIHMFRIFLSITEWFSHQSSFILPHQGITFLPPTLASKSFQGNKVAVSNQTADIRDVILLISLLGWVSCLPCQGRGCGIMSSYPYKKLVK